MPDYLGIPVATLYDWRVDGVGPKAVKLGRSLRYPESCVRAWIERSSVARPVQPLGTFGKIVKRAKTGYVASTRFRELTGSYRRVAAICARQEGGTVHRLESCVRQAQSMARIKLTLARARSEPAMQCVATSSTWTKIADENAPRHRQSKNFNHAAPDRLE